MAVRSEAKAPLAEARGNAGQATASLAEALGHGPLPLPAAVGYAREIARGAASLHRRKRAHGGLGAARIGTGPHGITLPPPNAAAPSATLSSDVRDFGLLFHQMLTGAEPEPSSPAARNDHLEPSAEGVRAAALRLAENCRRARAGSDLRRVHTELRLLQIMLTSLGSGAGDAESPGVERLQFSASAEPGRPEGARGKGPECPSCGSENVFRARQLTMLERALAAAELRTYRCYRCRQRFIELFGLRWARPESR